MAKKKDSVYFPHFANARRDTKVKRVMMKHGAQGYAAYFMLLEVLREQTGFTYPVDDIELLPDEFKVSEEVIKSIVYDFDLFIIEDGIFRSEKQVEYLRPYLEKSAKMSEVQSRIQAQRRQQKEENYKANSTNLVNTYQELTNQLPNQDQEHSKELVNGEKELDITYIHTYIHTNIPTREAVCSFALNNFIPTSYAEYWFDKYNSKNWETTNGKIQHWEQYFQKCYAAEGEKVLQTLKSKLQTHSQSKQQKTVLEIDTVYKTNLGDLKAITGDCFEYGDGVLPAARVGYYEKITAN